MSGVAPRAPHAAIELRAVSKAFGGRMAVRHLDLQIARGTFVALVGASGSGKTTTLKTINRLIDVDAGEVCVEGQSVLDVAPHELRRRIGYVFQGIGLFPHLSVAENIGITPQLLRWSAARIRQRVMELLDLVHLPREVAERLPATLSGGQQQRVGVARALAAQPALMLMDEPFGALDPLTRAALGEEYRRVHEQLQLTTVMVTHDVLEAVLLADRIVMMRAGKIVADGTPRQLLESHDDPDVRALMDVPLRQALRVRALLTTEARDG